MVSYKNQPRSLKERRLEMDGGTWPGSLSSCVAGNVFIEVANFEVDSSLE